MAAAPTAVRQRTPASCTSNASSAVWAWVPLMNARPSFGAKRNGASPAAASAGPAGTRRTPAGAPLDQLAFTHQREPDVTQRRKVAARADAALLRHQRQESRVQDGNQRVHEIRTHAAGRPEQHVGAEQHQSAHDVGRKRIAHAGGVAADQVGLELVEIVRRDANVGELAESGVDPVHRAPTGDRGLDRFPAGDESLAGGAVNGNDRLRAARNPHHVRDGERAAVEHQRRV